MFATLAAATLSLAIVTQDPTPLRAAPVGSTTTQALLTAGDLLEVRGERLDHLQVYDHQRERAGYVKASQVRPLGLALLGCHQHRHVGRTRRRVHRLGRPRMHLGGQGQTIRVVGREHQGTLAERARRAQRARR